MTEDGVIAASLQQLTLSEVVSLRILIIPLNQRRPSEGNKKQTEGSMKGDEEDQDLYDADANDSNV